MNGKQLTTEQKIDLGQCFNFVIQKHLKSGVEIHQLITDEILPEVYDLFKMKQEIKKEITTLVSQSEKTK